MPRPRKTEQAIAAAGMMLLGRTPRQAAEASGISDRAFRKWRARPEWSEVMATARERWLDQLVADARDAVSHAMLQRDDAGKIVRADGRLALTLLERLDPKLAPAPQTFELRALLSRINPDELPDEVVDQLSKGNVLNVLMGMLTGRAPMGQLAPGTDGEIVVDPDGVPE